MIEGYSYTITFDNGVLSQTNVDILKRVFKKEIHEYNKLSWFKKQFGKLNIRYMIKVSRWTNSNDEYEKIICSDGYTIKEIINAIDKRELFLNKFNR